MATIEIGSWSSKCLNCGKGADPSETGHYRELGYSTPPNTAGCGEKWDEVSISYVYENMEETVEYLKAHRFPHLASLKWNYFSWPKDNK